MNDSLNRRNLLRNTLATAAASLALKAGASCQTTEQQPEGPFYPIDPQADTNNDLVYVSGQNGFASGEKVCFKGVVKDQDCNSVQNAIVEIWQANKHGRYNHPSDPSPMPHDQKFQYWGITRTNALGEFIFRTIKPGEYAAGGSWIRPPHIHVKIHLRGYEELITQVYFGDEQSLNSKDRILQSLSHDQKKAVVLQYQKSQTPWGLLKTGEFYPILRKVF